MSDRPFRIVQLSDLHLTGDDAASRSEPRLFGKLRGMNSVFRRLLATKLVRSADRILVTGDVADTGSLAEWLDQGCPSCRKGVGR